MSRLSIWVACLGMVFALSGPASQASAGADISINLRVGDPYRGPRLVFHDEPDIVVVPGTRVYYVRDYDYDIYRYGNYWYYNYDGEWYRSRRYSGPFVYVGYRSVPRAVTYVPVKYRKHWRDGHPGRARGHYKAKEVHHPGRGDGHYKHKDDRGHEKGGKGHKRGGKHDR